MDQSTRSKLLEHLKRNGPQTATTLAGQFGISAMAARQHLYGLAAEDLVAAESRAMGIGRPAKFWGLTQAADAFFPQGYGELTADLLGAMRAAFGEEGIARILAVRTACQRDSYRQQLHPTKDLGDRVAALARIREAEGYMAKVEKQEDGGFLLIENHCPICAAARACTGLCAAELSLFREVLGPDVEVERAEHILTGARRCAYRIAPAA